MSAISTNTYWGAVYAKRVEYRRKDLDRSRVREFGHRRGGSRPSYVRQEEKMTVREFVEVLIDSFLKSKILGFTGGRVCSKAKNT